MKILDWLTTTGKGWLLRQALKFGTIGGAMTTAWLISNGADADKASAIGAAVGTGAVMVAEMMLSLIARNTSQADK